MFRIMWNKRQNKNCGWKRSAAARVALAGSVNGQQWKTVLWRISDCKAVGVDGSPLRGTREQEHVSNQVKETDISRLLQ